jgi:putative chitinase
MDYVEKYRTLFKNYEINTPLRKAHFMAQIQAESGLIPKRESLYYTSSSRLKKIFKSPFKDKSDSFIEGYTRNTEKLANFVYANRMGNGNECSGDGFKYRGGGFIQLTGKNNYEKLSKDTGIDYINNPELLENEADALISALWFWKKNGLNKHADKDSLDHISDIINIGRITNLVGDANGYEHRLHWLSHYKKIYHEK